MNTKHIITWILRLVVAIILLQTLYFKFTAHPDSVHIFSSLGVEPWGRISLGIIELITAFLVLYNKTQIVGMINSLGIIIGAVFSHFLVIGINVSGDGGGLFILAVIVFVACVLFMIINKIQIIKMIQNLKNNSVL